MPLVKKSRAAAEHQHRVSWRGGVPVRGEQAAALAGAHRAVEKSNAR